VFSIGATSIDSAVRNEVDGNHSVHSRESFGHTREFGGEKRRRGKTRKSFAMMAPGAGIEPAVSLTSMELSHAELRAAVIIAGSEIRKLNFGRKNTPVLRILRRALRESRAVARGEGEARL
jgi:hypothetical protein